MKLLPLCFLLSFALSKMNCTVEAPEYLDPLYEILESMKEEFPQIIANPEKYELQVRYSQIEQMENGSLDLRTFAYREDPKNYFYPASTVKMPVAFLAVEKCERLQAEGHDITIDTPIQFLDGTNPMTEFLNDPTAKDEQITIRHLINRVFSVSDNNAYNRLYEFLGRDEINPRLRQLGLSDLSRIVHRVGTSEFDNESNKNANAFEFYKDENVSGETTFYSENCRYSKGDYFNEAVKNTIKGIAYLNGANEIVNEPFDMSLKNFIPIKDLETCVQRITFPELFSEEKRFRICEDNLNFLRHSMARLPREHIYPKYEQGEFYDGYGKFFMYGDNEDIFIPDEIRIFNKVGYAYGTLTDAALIVDFKNELAFFLTATILVNDNQTFNDGVYEYDDVGIPFLASLGRKVHEYELSRERKSLDLSRFQLDFSKEY